MDQMRILLSRCAALFSARKLNAELDEELQAHIDMAIEDQRRRGLPEPEARTEALRAFGGVTQVKERYREQRGLPLIEQLGRDFRFAMRQLLKSPGFTLVALLTLAVGVGANTVVFSLIDGILLRALPVPRADQLAVLRIEEGGPAPGYGFCAPFLRSLEKRHEVFANVFAFSERGKTLQVRGSSGNENVSGVLVSGQFFQALETPPLLGRYLTPLDDQPGGSPEGLAVVVSEAFWKSWFNHAPDVVGRKMVIANTPFTVVGVMPKRFIGADPTHRPELFVPLSAEPIIDAPIDLIDTGNAFWINVMGRLQPGVSLAEANAELLTVSDPILHGSVADAGYIADEEKNHFHFAAGSGSRGYTYMRTMFRKPLAAMFAMCGGILLLACLNLASLLMARGAARQRELATRLAMGATRGRLIHQLMTGSFLLAVLGTAAGLAVVPVASRALGAMLMSGLDNPQVDTSLDLRVFGFAALIALVSAVLIGLIPALQATAGNLSEAIKDGQHARQAHERRRILSHVLLASEVAVAVMLLVGAGLLATSLTRLFQSGVGFDPKGLVNIAFQMDKQSLEGNALMQLYRQLGEGLSSQPGVKSVSFESVVPLSLLQGWNGYYSTPEGGKHLIFLNSVAPDYFKTMRMPVFAGREFSWNDIKASGLKMILNETAARQLFSGGNALGQQVLNAHEKIPYEVVAVVGDSKYRDMSASAPPIGYVPMMQDPRAKQSFSAVVRMDGSPAPLAAAARALAAKLAPNIPAPVMTTMDEVMNESVSAERMMALLAVFFAGCALLVTGIGLYGALAYATERRTREIGIRIALGARRGEVVAMVFKENTVAAVIGSGAGVILSALLSRALASFLYETSPRDPWVLVGSVGALTVVASAASLLPALRAAWIEPMQALRME